MELVGWLVLIINVAMCAANGYIYTQNGNIGNLIVAIFCAAVALILLLSLQ